SLRWSAKGIEVAGMLTEQEQKAWMEIRDAFLKRFNNNPMLLDLQPEIKGLNIRSVSLGKEPFILLENGDKVTVGGKISDSYLVYSIEEKKIVLQQGNNLINYYLEGLFK
ncbi:MAG: hypothetical protein HQK54_10515, partial [Oligoflexales bacterium]|nr:hypothetical protein [Oligoflexales bacterium]